MYIYIYFFRFLSPVAAYRLTVFINSISLLSVFPSWHILDSPEMATTSSGMGKDPSPVAATQRNYDISVGQRMVSATCGSLLTALLGTSLGHLAVSVRVTAAD